jgi:hypothetical protein
VNGLCYLEEFARRLAFSLSPLDLQVARKWYVYVYALDVDVKEVVEAFDHG